MPPEERGINGVHDDSKPVAHPSARARAATDTHTFAFLHARDASRVRTHARGNERDVMCVVQQIISSMSLLHYASLPRGPKPRKELANIPAGDNGEY